MTGPSKPSSQDELREISERLRQAVELQRLIREGSRFPEGGTLAALRRTATARAAPEGPPAPAVPSEVRPAARVTEAPGAERPRIAPAARVLAPAPGETDLFESPPEVVHEWQRDPSESGSLGELHDRYAACLRCPLGETRANFVFGVGNPKAGIMFVGEAPGRDEDLQGEPFVGRAGQLLNKILEAIGLRREDVYIANILKCRPPGNRDPQPTEIASCLPILARQIELIHPLVFVHSDRSPPRRCSA